MRKLLSVFLMVTMLLPICLPANAAQSSTEIKPFRITNSTDLETDFDNFYPKIHFWSRASDEYITDDSIRVSVPGVGGKTPKEIAENLKPIFDEYPDGMRYLRFTALRAAMVYHLEDTIFMEKGIRIMKEWWEEFIYHYKSIGGKIDGVVADVEYFDGFSYYVNRDAKEDPMLYYNIVNNPNYATKIRPALEERGFKFWPNVTELTPEIYGLDTSTGDDYLQSRSIWDVVIRNHYNQYVNDVFLNSLMECYPEAVLCDYQARDTYAWLKIPKDQGGLTTGGNYYTAGNVNYFNTYAARPGTGFFKKNGFNKVDGYNNITLQDNAYNMMLWETMFAKNLKASAPNDRLTITITYYNYSGRETSYCNTPYYSEVVYHMGMLDPDPFQSYCIAEEIENRGSNIEYSIQIISELLNELTRVAGAADRKHIPMPHTWNDKFILTGMYAGGRNIWRITPDTIGTNTTLESFKVAGAKDPTFTIEGQTVTFPGGKVLEDSKITEVGTCGYWVETPENVLPEISYDVNRYEMYPSFQETFESYEVNKGFDVDKAYPTNCWAMRKTSTSSGKVVADGNGKALAVNGNYSLTLQNVLAQITAGDTYAEKQVWSLDVTIPEDMPQEGEVCLLGIYGGKTTPVNGGFRIAGGKLYYDNAGTYVELSGVDVSKGGKFTLKRFMDFTNPDAFTCTYQVYDQQGNLVGLAKDTPINKMTLPVEKIGLNTVDLGKTAILVDNLKLYTYGLTTDFELYNAKTGIEYIDLETAKDSNTVYRLSWQNASAYDKTCSVIAAFYEGDTLVEEKVIKQLNLAPGADGVDTDIVEVAEGRSVRIYVRDDSAAEPELQVKQPENTQDVPTAAKKGNKTGLLVAVIAVFTVFIGIVVAAVVLLTKKPASKQTEKSEEKEAPKEETEE